jgi:hypothetical protein
MSDPATCSVWCDVHGGLTITEERRHEYTQDGQVTVRYLPVGDPVTLKPGLNEGVDAAWMARWLAAHAGDQAVRTGLIRVLEPQPPPLAA